MRTDAWRVLRYLFAGDVRFLGIFWLLFLGGWYLLSGHMLEDVLGMWSRWFDFVFLIPPLAWTVSAVRRLATARRRARDAHPRVPLSERRRTVQTWIEWMMNVPAANALLHRYYGWMANRLEGVKDQRRLVSLEELSRLWRWRAAVVVPSGLNVIAALALVFWPQPFGELVAMATQHNPETERYLEKVTVCSLMRPQCVDAFPRRLAGGTFEALGEVDDVASLRFEYDAKPRTRRIVRVSSPDYDSQVSLIINGTPGSDVRGTTYGRSLTVWFRVNPTIFQSTITISFETWDGRMLESGALTLVNSPGRARGSRAIFGGPR
jgi:hypothetical protein